jgi:hypothetical protein
MTGFTDPGMELSRMTVGGLDDIGYCVDYDSADPFDSSRLNYTACPCTVRIRQLEGSGSDTDGSRKRRKLSDEGRQAAIEHGESLLEERFSDGSSEYIENKIIVVIYEENGEIYSVTVTKV